MDLVNINIMRELTIENSELIMGGGFCQGVAVTEAVVAVGVAANYLGWIAFTPAAPAVLARGGLALAGATLYCAFS